LNTLRDKNHRAQSLADFTGRVVQKPPKNCRRPTGFHQPLIWFQTAAARQFLKNNPAGWPPLASDFPACA